MKGKILLVVGLAVGYVLGTRAGREKYEEIKATAAKLWNDPRVQKQVTNAQDFVKDKAPEVAEFVADGAKNVISKAAGGSKPAAPKTTTRTPAKKSTTTKK